MREGLARTVVREGANLHDPEVFTPYFRDVYQRVKTAPEVEVHGTRIPFQTAHERLEFEQVAAAYRMIADDTVAVVIRKYDPRRVDGILGGPMT